MKKDNRWCLLCNPKNRTIYFHLDEKSGLPWIWCNKCNRGYSLQQYCNLAGISIEEFVNDGIEFAKEQDNEVNALAWPKNFIPLSDPRAEKGIEYLKSRGISTDGDMYFDIEEEGIVFPYYVGNHFCGAQIRFIEERVKDDGTKWKITTLPGTRLGMLMYGFNQTKLMAQVKRVVVTEGAFNSLCLQQAFNHTYGGISSHPWKFIALSGSGVSAHQAEVLKDFKDQEYTVVAAPDTDEAGFGMLNKLIDADAITHFAFTGDSTKDWNDLCKTMDKKDLVNYFLRQIKNVKDKE